VCLIVNKLAWLGIDEYYFLGKELDFVTFNEVLRSDEHHISKVYLNLKTVHI
jgi:hypothetical protein